MNLLAAIALLTICELATRPQQAHASPPRQKDLIKQDDRQPVILNEPQEIVVGAGSNVSFSCSARGSQPLTFVWFQDEKNLTIASNIHEPSTKLLEERRYEIHEILVSSNQTTSILFLKDLKLTDTSTFLCWVENSAGYTIGNFSLIVNNSPPANLGVVDASNGRIFGLEQITIIIALLTALLTAIICLIVLRRMQTNGQAKSGQVKQMFTPSTDDERDERASISSSNSGSQTKKSNSTRVLAAEELDSFIDYMRSGIINMDYHSMSPVIQFNKQAEFSDPNSIMAHPQHHPQLHLQQSSQLSSVPSQNSDMSSYPPAPSYTSYQPSNINYQLAQVPETLTAHHDWPSGYYRPERGPTHMLRYPNGACYIDEV